MLNGNLNQCKDCIFNYPDFIMFCKAHATPINCPEFKQELNEKCTVCSAKLETLEFFVFGNKCAIHGIQD